MDRRRPARRDRQFDRLAQLALKLEDCGGLGGRQRAAAELPCAADDPPSRRAVADHGERQSFSELSGIRDPEEVKAGGVAAPSLRAPESCLADARLSRSSWTGHDHMGPAHEGGGDLLDVVTTPDHLTRRDRDVGRKEIAAGLAHAYQHTTYLHGKCVKITRIVCNH